MRWWRGPKGRTSSLILQNIEKIMAKCILSSCVQSTRPIDCTVSLCAEISRNILYRYRAVSPNKTLFYARYRLAYYVATIAGCENILKYLQFTNTLHQIRISVVHVHVFVYLATKARISKFKLEVHVSQFK